MTNKAQAFPSSPQTIAMRAVVPSTTVRQRDRMLDLDRAKGLAIIFVVFGHLVAQQDPPGVSWYEPFRIAIYFFHMPFFMYLSGYVTFLSGAAAPPPGSWGRLAARRVKRLLVPFLAFGLAIILAKLLATHLMTVDNVPGTAWDGLRSLFWNTAHSPAMSVWYMGVLFVYAVMTPPLLRLLRGSRLALALVAIALYLVAAPPVVYLDRICKYYVFFAAGGLAATMQPAWHRILDRWHLLAAVALAALLWYATLHVRFDWNADAAAHFPYKGYMLVAGLLSMVALHGLVRGVLSRSSMLLSLGVFCFAIYLLNTICIGLAKGALLHVLHWNATDFPLIAALLMIAGLLLPIAIKRVLLRHIPVLDRMTD